MVYSCRVGRQMMITSLNSAAMSSSISVAIDSSLISLVNTYR